MAKQVYFEPVDAAQVGELEALLQARLAGKVRDLHVSIDLGGLVLRGFARTYHAKQLAQHAAMAASSIPIHANEIEVS